MGPWLPFPDSSVTCFLAGQGAVSRPRSGGAALTWSLTPYTWVESGRVRHESPRVPYRLWRRAPGGYGAFTSLSQPLDRLWRAGRVLAALGVCLTLLLTAVGHLE